MTSKQNTNSQPIELQFHVEPDAWLPVSELLTMFHPANSQTRNRAELDAIKRHLSDEGFTAEMIVVNPINRKIVSGHGRTQAAHELGYTGTLPVVYREYTTDAEHRRAMLRWNLARGHQDEAKEAAEFAALLAEFDRADLAADFGMVEGEFEALLKEFAPPTPLEDPGAQVDRAEELRKKWGVELGQMWQLGAHRLICGDCTDAGVVGRVMGGERADMVFTDPPYGVEFQGKGGDSIEGDISYALIPLLFADLPGIVADKCWIYICGGSSNYSLFARLFDRYFRNWPRVIVWDKGPMTMRHNGYHSAYEFVYHTFTKGAGDWWFGSRAGEAATDIWRIQKPNIDRLHLTEKPIELPARAIGNTCPPGGIVWEPFSGSGSTLAACEQLSRKCRAVEISPAYVAVALQRWADMTGQTPELLP